MDVIAERFATAVARDPDAIAVDSSDARYTYAELAGHVQQVAARLHKLTEQLDDDTPRIAGIFARHGADAIIGSLGAVLAGWAYTPLDPRASSEELTEMFFAANVSALIVDGPNTEQAYRDFGSDCHMLILPEMLEDMAGVNALPVSLSEDRPAYLLHTSGSSGRPKTVVHSRASLIRSVDCYCADSDLKAGDQVTLVTPLGFTPSVFCLFGALLSGATLCPFDIGEGTDGIAEWMLARDLALLYTTPTVFRRLAYGLPDVDGGDSAQPASLRMIQLAGEPLLASDAALFRRKFTAQVRLYNGMGTTETSCAARFVIDHEMRFPDGPVPVGVPYDDVELVLRSSKGRMLGAGEIGNLSIRGDYFDAPNEEGMQSKTKEFDTGDLAMCDEGGRFVHLGRREDRVTIDGVSVDLPEIESLLMRMQDVREAAVIVGGGENAPQVAAFVCVVPDADTDANAIQDRLALALPRQMRPTQCRLIETLPMLTAGKVDRLALRARMIERSDDAEFPEPVPDAVDEAVMTAFCEVLGQVSLAGNSDFFALGGDTLGALDLVMRIERSLGIGLSVSRFAHAPTPINLAHELRRQIKYNEQARTVSDMDAVWQLDHGSRIERMGIDAADIPEPVRGLLDHQSSMTAMLAKWAGSEVALRVLAQRQAGRYFMRKIELVSASGEVLAIAAIRVDLQAFGSEVRLEIISGEVPFGTIMNEHGIQLTHRPKGFFATGTEYGRTNRIEDERGQLLADVIELLRVSA